MASLEQRFKEGDTITATIVGKVEKVRGDAIVITAHGVEIPVLASQVNAPTLAQQILEAIRGTEEDIGDIRSIVTTQDVTRLLKLKEEIKELCQKEVNKQ
jgi:hypothetical protein